MKPQVEWHQRKAQSNLRKHGVSFEEAATIFLDPLALTIPDPQHSMTEDRFIDIGLSANGRLLVVVYTERGSKMRIISAREATHDEQKTYEHE